MTAPAKRANLQLLLLGGLTLGLLMFPVRLQLGMDWFEAQGRLGLVMNRQIDAGTQPQWPKQRLDLVLPGKTYLHLRSLPAPGRELGFSLAAIRLGEPGAGVPPKGSGLNLTVPLTELDLAAYSYPRFLGYICAGLLIVALIRRAIQRRQANDQVPVPVGQSS